LPALKRDLGAEPGKKARSFSVNRNARGIRKDATHRVSTKRSRIALELVEVMEIEHGLIRRHRVYWGWYALNVLKAG
jgi:hypothetical protein